MQEGAPELGKDGLMYVTTQAAVRIREVQKSLNQMSRDERIDFIRNNGDPKISVAISVRGDGAAAAPQNSQVAENLLKERIKSFGFRIWTDDTRAPAAPGKGADFAVIGEAKLKKLSARLAASGISIEKYMLTSWTVKCVDRQSGEEIYFNNKLPVAAGSWALPSSIAKAATVSPATIPENQRSACADPSSARTAATEVVRNGDGVKLRPISSSTKLAST